jgi:hypothetical protein
MRHRVAGVEDSEIVGELYHQLIKDDGYRNQMTTPKLIDRIRTLLTMSTRVIVASARVCARTATLHEEG